MKQERQDFIKKLFEVVEPINKDFIEYLKIRTYDDHEIFVWDGEYISLLIYYFGDSEYKLIISNKTSNSQEFWLTTTIEQNWDDVAHYFTQFNLLENITIDSLNEYTISILAKNCQQSFGGSYDEGITGYEDALTFIMNKHKERRANNI